MYNFEEYRRIGEPDKAYKSEIWETAIGLQKVDGLTPSEYLVENARQHIDGDITIEEVKQRLQSYYEAKPLTDPNDRTEEADKVSAHIAEILSEQTFTFSPVEYISVHKRLFDSIYKFAGRIRDYNISKSEWVLNGDTVVYAGAGNIMATLEYDFAEEKAFKYQGLTKRQMAEHFADFISRIWQIHAFGEGNTRTTAVFAIKYLRTLGFDVSNDMFAEHAWYFRNALVRANYNDYVRNIFSTQEYLDRFFGNLLLGENNVLRNRDMLVVSKHDSVNANNDSVNDSVKIGTDTIDTHIINTLLTDPKGTAVTLSQTIGVSVPTINRHLKKLKAIGKIERVGSDKTGSWKVR